MIFFHVPFVYPSLCCFFCLKKSTNEQQISTDFCSPGNKKQQPQLPPSQSWLLGLGGDDPTELFRSSHHDGLRKAWGPWHPTASSGTQEINNRQ
jgi:hypothetical protein